VTVALHRDTPRPRVGAQAVYYLGWISMFAVESVAWATLGLVLGIVVFILGGMVWSSWQAAHTRDDERLRGPILRLTRRLVDTGTATAFLGAVLVGGPPGVAAAAAAGARADRRRLILIASILYALLWATFHALRPQGALPMHLGPTLPG
jgi:hypothetical protein